MKYVALVTIALFLGMIHFGFISMDHNAHHDMTTHEAPCPIGSLYTITSTDDVAMALGHANALYSFSNTPISTVFLFLNLMLCGLLLWFVLHNLHLPVEVETFLRQKIFYIKKIYSRDKERSWLSLFENSPSFA